MRPTDFSDFVQESEELLPKVLGESVLLAHIDREEKEQKVGSIFLPASAENKFEPDKFLVLAVGPGRVFENRTIPVQVDVGDVVVVGHPGTELHYDGKTYYVANQANIIAVLPE